MLFCAQRPLNASRNCRSVDFHSEVTRGGCGQKLGLFSRHKAEAFTVFDWASATKGHFDACFVVPTDVGVNLVNKLGRGEGPPITRIEEFRLQASEEAFTCGIVLRTRLSRHRTNELCCVYSFQPARPAIVASAIAVDYGPRFAVSDGFYRCIKHGVYEIGVRSGPKGVSETLCMRLSPCV